MPKSIFLLLTESILLASGALAQTPSPKAGGCNVEIPVSVVGKTGALIEGIQLGSLEVRKAKSPLSLQTIDYDKGPRRIVFVIDKTSDINPAAAQIVEAMLETVLQRARPQDSFAVVTSGPVGLRIPFGQKAEAVLAQLRQARPTHDSTSMLDATEEAAEWLGTPDFGDSIFVFSGSDKFAESRTPFKKLFEDLTQKRIRVFGALFDLLMAGEYFDFARVWSFSPDTEDWHNLILGSGGHLLLEYTHNPSREYKLTADRTKELQMGAWQLYGTIAQTYRLTVSSARASKRAQWEVGFSPSAQAKWPHASLLYSRFLPLCN